MFFSERGGTSSARGWGALPNFFFFFFSCSADHERDWPPCKVVFFGWATNALNVRNNNNNNNSISRAASIDSDCCRLPATSVLSNKSDEYVRVNQF